MNPSLKIILALLISLEISFWPHLSAQMIVIGFCLVALFCQGVRTLTLFKICLLPLLPASAMWVTFYFYATKPSLNTAWTMFTRIYAYVFIGVYLQKTLDSNEVAHSLEQNLKWPSKIVYGTLAALNLLPQMMAAIRQIRTAALMRGIYLSFWSPKLYFKAILVANTTADHLAQGMISHGYQEDQPRSCLMKIPLRKRDWGLFFLLIALFQPLLFGLS